MHAREPAAADHPDGRTRVIRPGIDEQAAEVTELGITLAVDDFGTGYSTFEYLLSLPISAVKIDPTFTHRLGEPRAAALLRGLSSACRELGMSVVVEGVESEEQFEAARRTGATHAQGFHLAVPAPIEELAPPDELAA